METIYTIPINEAFDNALELAQNGGAECPFCKLAASLEENELDLILGASMMEPDIRIKTNELGFCKLHFAKMRQRQKVLPLALMLESHLIELRSTLEKKGIPPFGATPDKNIRRLKKLSSTCYVCERAGNNLKRMMSNAVYMWEVDPEFREKVKGQKYFCVEHFSELMEAGETLGKKKFQGFYEDFSKPLLEYLGSLCGDVSHFCKKFDYRYENEPWGNSKDSVERSIKFLVGE